MMLHLLDIIIKLSIWLSAIGVFWQAGKLSHRAVSALTDISRSLKMLIDLAPDIKRTSRLAPVADALIKEFRPNGGSSMKDAVTETLRLVAEAKSDAKEAKEESTAARLETSNLKKITLEQNAVLEAHTKSLNTLTERKP